jgi:molybdate transport system substrate-binding protein
VQVAAAADLSLAFHEVGDAYTRATGQPVRFTFGSTGQLARQLAEGAPFDLFAAANLSFVQEVVRGGACDGASQRGYARGRIGTWTNEGPGATLTDLASERFTRIAIANPDHAPYGHAAREALRTLKLWDAVRPKLVFAENVQQALQYARTGNADAAIVALSIARTDVPTATFTLIDAGLHAPLDQAMVTCRRGSNAAGARAFAEFVGSPAGRAIMVRYGFVLPGETPPGLTGSPVNRRGAGSSPGEATPPPPPSSHAAR